MEILNGSQLLQGSENIRSSNSYSQYSTKSKNKHPHDQEKKDIIQTQDGKEEN